MTARAVASRASRDGARPKATHRPRIVRDPRTSFAFAFDRGEYAPHTDAGRRLIAHELSHVIDQAQSPALGATVMRQGRGPAAPTTPAQWVNAVDRAVRAEFGLRGTALTPARVQFLEPAQFEVTEPPPARATGTGASAP